MRQDRRERSENDWYWETYLQLLFRRERPTFEFQQNGNDSKQRLTLTISAFRPSLKRRDLKQKLSPLLNVLISITWSLFSLLVALVRHLSSPSLVHHHLPLSKSQIALSDMHHPVFGIIFLPHSVNLIHHLSPPSHHPSLPLSSIPDLKLTCSTNPSHHRFSPTHRTAYWTSTGLPSRTPYHSALCFSSSVIFFQLTRV